MSEILGDLDVLKKDAVEFKGSIVIVDAVNFLDQLEDIETGYISPTHVYSYSDKKFHSLINKYDFRELRIQTLVELRKYQQLKNKEIRALNRKIKRLEKQLKETINENHTNDRVQVQRAESND